MMILLGLTLTSIQILTIRWSTGRSQVMIQRIWRGLILFRLWNMINMKI